ncbi:MAG: hypothetical protein IPP14_12660 [Planctomycetes bacterium]|nr:hypothetical protein [Planctomycetota bacterium]
MHHTQLTLAGRQLLAAPFIGALGGFLANRAHAGSTGWLMLAEMAAGSVVCLLGAACFTQIDALGREARRRDALRSQLRAQEQAVVHNARRAELLAAEEQRYVEHRMILERSLVANRKSEKLEVELSQTRRDTVKLANVVASLVSSMRQSAAGDGVLQLAQEAKARMAALESAQRNLETRQIELDRKTASEAQEVKTRLLTLSISDSQRQRNVSAPDADSSGRLIELETRIRKLAAEIERLSNRQPAATQAGEASKVGTAGTGDGARLGFLKAMLEANQTLRKQIQDAA